MARSNYNASGGQMGNNSKQNQMVKNAAREVGISAEELSREVHELKGNWYEGDYSYSELLDIAREIKRRKNR